MACGGGDQRLAAYSEAERDSWIEKLHMAAYSYIQVSCAIIHICAMNTMCSKKLFVSHHQRLKWYLLRRS